MKKFLLIPLAIVLVTALIFAGCKPAEEVPTEIVIGGAETHTGVYTGFSRGGSFGVRTAIEDINSLGGIYVEEYGTKLPIRYVSTDNESDILKAGTLAEDMILRDKVNFMVQGVSILTMSAPVSTICDRYEVPFVCGSGPYEPYLAMQETVTPPWPYTWCPTFAIATPAPPGSFYDKPGMTMADSMMSWLKTIVDQTNGRVALYATDDANGKGWYELLPFVCEGAGLTIYGIEEGLGLHPLGTTDFTSIIQEWMHGDCDILLGNAPAPDTGTLLRQCRSMGYHPKTILAAQAGMFYQDVSAWGGDIPHGIVTERWWSNTYDPEFCPGIAGRTPQTLADYWGEKMGEPLHPAIGLGYTIAQVLFDAIERAGSLDGPTVNKAFPETDLPAMSYHIIFNENHLARYPVFLSQWRETDKPEKWECQIIFTPQEFMGEPAEMIFPIPYD